MPLSARLEGLSKKGPFPGHPPPFSNWTYLMVRCGCIVGMMSRVGTAATPAIAIAVARAAADALARAATAIARAVVVVAQIGLAVSLVDDQVDGHLALQATDVPLTEVVAQFVNLHKGRKHVQYITNLV